MPMANKGLAKLLEESAEVSQVAAKALAVYGLDNPHWTGDLRVMLEDELADLIAAITFVIDCNELDFPRIEGRAADKLAMFRQWHKQEGN